MSRCVAECHGVFYYTLGACQSQNCGERSQLVYTATQVGTPVDDGCKRTATYEFSVIDQCDTGALVSTATFTTEDTTPPTITGTIHETVVECDGVGNLGAFSSWLASNAGASCSDDCGTCTWNAPVYETDTDGNPVYTHCTQPDQKFYISGPDSACGRCIHVVFEAEDDCGLKTQTSAVFRTEDTTPPQLNGMNRLDECNPSSALDYRAWIRSEGDATAVDVPDCSGVGLSSILGELKLFSSVGFTIPVGIHGTPPGALPAALIAELTDSYQSVDFTDATAKCPFVSIIRVTGEDVCGNEDAINISHVLADTTPPTFSVAPRNAIVECSDWLNGGMTEIQDWLEAGGGGVCADSCSLLPLPSTVPKYDLNSLTVLTGSCPGTLDVNFYCEDFCGNRAAATATVEVRDTIAPVVTAPRDRVVECRATDVEDQTALDKWLDGNGWSTGYDACTATEQLAWTSTSNGFVQDATDTEKPNKCSNKHAEAGFQVMDECGNSAETATATYTVRDTVAPVFNSAGHDLVYECSTSCTNRESLARDMANKWVAQHGCIDSVDECQSYVEWDVALPSTNLCGTSGQLTFTATDGCGNANSQVLTYRFPAPRPTSTAAECESIGNIDVCDCIPYTAPAPPPPTVSAAEDVCVGGGKPIELSFTYVGGNRLTQNQGGKATVVGVPVDTQTAQIQCVRTNKGQYSPTTVLNLGGTYIVSAGHNKLGTELRCTIAAGGGAGIQTVTIHTSCSKPLFTGNFFGALQLSCFRNNKGHSCHNPQTTTFQARSTHCPTAPPGIPFTPSPPPPTRYAVSPNPPPTRWYDAAFPTLPPTPPLPTSDPCTTCGFAGGSKGALTAITFKYIGGFRMMNAQRTRAEMAGEPVTAGLVTVTCDADTSTVFTNARIATEEVARVNDAESVVVLIGGSFTITNFDSDTVCTVADGNKIQEITIDTSCASELSIGDVFGSIAVASFASTTAGIIGEGNGCLVPEPGAPTVPPTAPPGASPTTPSCDGFDVCANNARLTQLTLEYADWADNQRQTGAYEVIMEKANFRDTESITVSSGDFGVDLSATSKGDRFTLSASAIGRQSMPSALNFWVGTGPYRARHRFAVNCKYDLAVGDQFGALKVVGFSNDRGQTCELPRTPARTLNAAAAQTSSTDAADASAISVAAAGAVFIVLIVAVAHSFYKHAEHSGGAVSFTDGLTADDTSVDVPSDENSNMNMVWDSGHMLTSKMGAIRRTLNQSPVKDHKEAMASNMDASIFVRNASSSSASESVSNVSFDVKNEHKV
jgi:hypothetical protein